MELRTKSGINCIKRLIIVLLPSASVCGLFRISAAAVGIGLLTLPGTAPAQSSPDRIFRAGAFASNITPAIGTSINGNYRDDSVKNIHDETHVRCIVLDDGNTQLAIAVADLCMVSRTTLDKAKRRASAVTLIPASNMLISATHTHSGGTACSVFQSDPDPDYLRLLESRIADAVIMAYNNLAPARIGWGAGSEPGQVFNRRWKMKPGTPLINPFGNTDKVKMNPGIGNPNLLEPAGPTDPGISVVSVQSLDGTPVALLANYSLHYVGGVNNGDVSADYYGMFAARMSQLLNTDRQQNRFIAIMSNGTSGDVNNINFGAASSSQVPPYHQMQKVANIVAAETYKVLQQIRYQNWVSLSVKQKQIELMVRKPDKTELARAKAILSKANTPVLTSVEALYARETVLINDYPNQVSLILQAMRIGDLAITAIPCEVFAETGLEIKAESPFKPTFTISLANGYNGYLPTPAQHQLGGYETWRARSSYLEKDASVKITQSLFEMLGLLSKEIQPVNALER